MGRVLHAVEKGLRLLKENTDAGPGNSVDELFGAGAPPGTSGETDDAEIGSTYRDTNNGDFYLKQADTSSATDWVKVATGDGDTRQQLAGVVASSQVLDSVLVDDVLASEWEIHARDDANPENVKVIKVLATHDGEPSADAVNVDDTAYGKLKIGSNFTTQYTVELNGVGAAQVMRLSVTGQVGGVTFTSRRNDIKAP